MEAGEGPCPPDRRARLEANRDCLGQLSGLLGVLGALPLGLVLLGRFLSYGPVASADQGLTLFGLTFFLLATAAYARAKGRSSVWAVLGLGCFFGWLVLAYLPRLCGWCRRPSRVRLAACPDCGGPV